MSVTRYNVTAGEDFATIATLSGETKVIFSFTPNLIAVKAIGDDASITVARFAGAQSGDDGVRTIASGESTTIEPYNGDKFVYVNGTGGVEVWAGRAGEEIPPSFKKSAKGGGGGGSSSVIIPYTFREDGVYTPISGVDGYAPITIDRADHPSAEYDELEYLVCTSSQPGFTIPSMVYYANGDDIFEITSMIYEYISSESAILGYDGNFELMYKQSSGQIDYYNYVEILGGRYTVNTNIKHTFYARMKNNSTVNVGFYRLGNYPFSGRLYGIKAYRFSKKEEAVWNNIALNLVPCKRKSDDKVGFYDTVSETFFPSTTGAEFLAPSGE